MAAVAPLSAAELQWVMDSGIGATVSVFGRDLRFRYVNEGFAKAFNMTPTEMFGMPLSMVYGDVHRDAFMPYVNRALAGETVTYERYGRMQLSDGLWRTVSLTPWRDAQGEVIGIVSASLRVHELKVSMEALRAANERLSSHMENSPLTVMELDAGLNIIRCSARVTQMLGLDAAALTGMPLLDALGVGAFREPLRAAFARLQTGQEARNRVESSHLRSDGTTVHCEWFNSALTGERGEVTSIMALVEDVSGRVQAAQQLRDLALRDTLTGLPNRRALTDRLVASLIRSQRTREPVALLFIDLDGFKRVNDEFGHAAGDEVLREVAIRLLNAVRESDVVARLGGDEFVVLLDTEVHLGVPELVCQRIFEALMTPCEFPGGQAEVGASIGVAMEPTPPDYAGELLKRADAAMYEAKRAGKGCVRYAPSTQQGHAAPARTSSSLS